MKNEKAIGKCVESLDETAGENGKRQWWWVNFGNEEGNYVSVLVGDGEIEVVEHFDDSGNAGLIDMSDITLTAEEAVEKAKEVGLKGGNPDNGVDWAAGFNFKLQYASLAESPEDRRVFLEVIGVSPNGNFAHVDFDAETGELLLAEEKIDYDEEGAGWVEFN